MLKRIRRGRERLFGDGRPVPLDRNAKCRIMVFARAKLRRDSPGRHYGPVTAKSYAVLEALLWAFHNRHTGLCFPSYESIAKQAGCARSTVALAIKALEAAGILTWCNRLRRVRVYGPAGWRWRVVRTSNGYRFTDQRDVSVSRQGDEKHWVGREQISRIPSKSDLPPGTTTQMISYADAPSRRDLTRAETPLESALERLKISLHRRKPSFP